MQKLGAGVGGRCTGFRGRGRVEGGVEVKGVGSGVGRSAGFGGGGWRVRGVYCF